MAEKKPQTFANHAKYDPAFHFFLIPVFALSVIAALVHLHWHPSLHAGAFLVISIAALIALFKIRIYALKVQDRVIRLEERQRLMLLLPESMRARIPELTESQLVALRFAPDPELPALAQRAIVDKLSNADIKKAIQNWRPDYFRI
jgi:hypothetical protein